MVRKFLTRALPCLLLVALLAASFRFTKVYLKHLVVAIPPLLSPDAADWPVRLAFSVGLTLFWLGLGVALARWGKHASSGLTAPVSLAASFGWGMLALLVPAALGVPMGRPLTMALLVAPAILMAILFLRPRRGEPAPRPRASASPAARYGSVACMGLVAVHLVFSFLWLPLEKPPPAPSSDEWYFWHTGAHMLHERGWEGYLTAKFNNSFDPGYPFIASTLLAFVPGEWTLTALPAVPFFHGIFLVALAMSGPYRRWSQVGLMALLAGGILFAHGWMYMMFFQLWYGEAMGIAVVASILWAFSALRHESRLGLRFFVFAGLGALAQLSKPPVNSLLLMCIVPFLFAGFCVIGRRDRKNQLASTAFLAAGALVARWAWKGEATRAGIATSYSFSFAELLDFDVNMLTENVLPYWKNFPQVWIYLAITVLLALRHFRRYALPLGVGLGLVLAVLILFGSRKWGNHLGYASSGRYMLHGACGWILFYISRNSRLLVRYAGNLRSWMSSWPWLRRV